MVVGVDQTGQQQPAVELQYLVAGVGSTATWLVQPVNTVAPDLHIQGGRAAGVERHAGAGHVP